MIAHLRAVRLEGRAARIPINVDDVAVHLDHASIFMSPTNNPFKSTTAGFGSYRYLLRMQKWDAASIGIARTLAVTTKVSR
jgi:hypothetical protein